MQTVNNLLIIGGDNRQHYIADFLERNGFKVSVYGLSEKNRKSIKNIKSAAQNADAVIFPLPVSKDGKYITSTIPINETLDDILLMINKECVVFGGMINRSFESKLLKKDIKFYDYFKREEVTVKNTVPTVQGILKAMIDNIDYTIHSSKCAVFGFGRVARITADILSSIGADVTVCARKQGDLANAEIRKIKSCKISEFYKISNEYDIIINTIPSLVIDKKILENVKSDCLIIDVASAPYGTDFATAFELGLNAVQCPSLPGKVAPKTAGNIIAEAIINILEEENLWKK